MTLKSPLPVITVLLTKLIHIVHAYLPYIALKHTINQMFQLMV